MKIAMWATRTNDILLFETTKIGDSLLYSKRLEYLTKYNVVLVTALTLSLNMMVR